jgi:serine/threonine protein phosphatase Stp1
MLGSALHSCATHAGAVRGDNQDAMLCRPEIGLFAVADGAGGHQDGGYAARLTLEALAAIPTDIRPETLPAELRARCLQAHQALRDAAHARGANAVLATTLVALLVHRRHFACLWAGDSRAYLLRDGMLHRLTNDHSVVQSLIDAGELTEMEAEHHPSSHVITRAVGAGEAPLALDKRAGELLPGDRLLLCSDGLYKTLPEARIAAILGDGNEDISGCLVEAALVEQARDNVTVVSIGPWQP